MLTEWKISKGQRACIACQHDFAAGESYYSALFDSDPELRREDRCPTCWPEVQAEWFSFWRTRAPLDDAKPKRMQVDPEVLWDLFIRLEQPRNSREANFRYFISLLLLRKKRLRFENLLREDEKDYLLLSSPRDGDLAFRVRDIRLSEEEIEQVRLDLSALLDSEI